MSSGASLSGSCACGAVRYSIEAPPLRSFQCQCRDCQKDTGGGHSSVMVFPTAAVDVVGEVKETYRVSDTGFGKKKGFCGECGAPIYNKPESKPEFIGIYVGSLDDASTFKPSIVLYCARGYSWDLIDPDVPHLPGWHERPS